MKENSIFSLSLKYVIPTVSCPLIAVEGCICQFWLEHIEVLHTWLSQIGAIFINLCHLWKKSAQRLLEIWGVIFEITVLCSIKILKCLLSYKFKSCDKSNLATYRHESLWKPMRCLQLKFSKALKLCIFDRQILFVTNKCYS